MKLKLFTSDATNSSEKEFNLPTFEGTKGLQAVKEGRFPGKTVIFPTISGLPLISVEEMKDRLPNVWNKLKDGKFWTREAETELYETHLPK